MRVATRDEILEALKTVDVLPTVATGFIAYSAGEAVVPPVGELLFERPPGDVHIKYGYLRGGRTYVVKIASGFYENPARGLPSSNGMMLVFDRATGVPVAVLLDEGALTDIRTAAAGAIAARALARPDVARIGIVGTGIQARLQLRYLAQVTACRDVVVWGRSADRAAAYRDEMSREGFVVEVAPDVASLAAQADLIVTTTPATAPLLLASHVRPGTHITAVGADTPGKQELESALVAKADVVVADAIRQCVERGECAHAVGSGALDASRIIELGAVLAGTVKGRTSRDQITLADLTGVAVQDVQIATAVSDALASMR